MKSKGGWTALATGAVLAASLSDMPLQAQGTGEKTYKAKCAGCHGPDGKGETSVGKAMKVQDFCSDTVKKESDAVLANIIKKGKNKMPSYEAKLTDAEIKDVVAYIRSLCNKK